LLSELQLVAQQLGIASLVIMAESEAA
jgi:hypothetical protein